MSHGAEHAEPVAAAGRRYSAFISYSHADAAFAKRLHRQLETYRLPARLTARAGDRLKDGRLKPLFRDDDELEAAADLTAAVKDALGRSDHLIVVCSPQAKASPWVAREIALFRSLHPHGAILAALADGEPSEAFPEALTDGGREPLAADFRGDGSGRRLALIKLVAVLAGVPLDEFVQRDAQRRMQQVVGVAAAGVAGMAVMGVLTAVAVVERSKAEHERNKAQAMVGYMVTDLRKGVKGSGNLELLNEVTEGASAYYQGEDLTHMSDTALEQRAKLLQAMGEDNEKKGDLVSARKEFEEARRTTAALLAKRPNEPQRIFDQAQSEYWVGFINWRNGDAAAARAGFNAYAALAQRLARLDPRNDAWVMETIFAANGQGMLALRQDGEPARAEPYYRYSVAQLLKIVQRKPDDRDTLISLANAYAWLADCQRMRGDASAARESRDAQRMALLAILATKPRDVGAQEGLLSHDLGMARIDIQEGKFNQAVKRLEAGRMAALDLGRHDPENRDFAKQARMFELFKARAWLDMPARSRPRAEAISEALGDCQDPKRTLGNEEIGDFCAVLLARLRTTQGDLGGAQAALAPVREHARKHHDVLTAHWGLNLAEETRLMRVASGGGIGR